MLLLKCCCTLSNVCPQDVADMRSFLEQAGLKHTSILAKVRLQLREADALRSLQRL